MEIYQQRRTIHRAVTLYTHMLCVFVRVGVSSIAVAHTFKYTYRRDDFAYSLIHTAYPLWLCQQIKVEQNIQLEKRGRMYTLHTTDLIARSLLQALQSHRTSVAFRCWTRSHVTGFFLSSLRTVIFFYIVCVRFSGDSYFAYA